MNTLLIDIAVGLLIFSTGIALTIRRYGTTDRGIYTIVAIITPALAVYSIFRVLILLALNKLTLEPCPAGLDEAEKIVEIHRQQMFGGELRESVFTKRWQLAYERELQKDAEHVQRIARRYLVIA